MVTKGETEKYRVTMNVTLVMDQDGSRPFSPLWHCLFRRTFPFCNDHHDGTCPEYQFASVKKITGNFSASARISKGQGYQGPVVSEGCGALLKMPRRSNKFV
jgi:hypothetical protein